MRFAVTADSLINRVRDDKVGKAEPISLALSLTEGSQAGKHFIGSHCCSSANGSQVVDGSQAVYHECWPVHEAGPAG